MKENAANGSSHPCSSADNVTGKSSNSRVSQKCYETTTGLDIAQFAKAPCSWLQPGVRSKFSFTWFHLQHALTSHAGGKKLATNLHSRILQQVRPTLPFLLTY